MFGEIDVFTLILTSAGSRMYFSHILRIGAGMVAEKRAVCLSSGICSKIHSMSSMNPMLNISSASSSTMVFTLSNFRVPLLI